MTSQFSRNLERIQSCEDENWSEKTVSNVLLPLFSEDEWVQSFLSAWKCRLQKEESPKLRLLFLSLFIFYFFYFLICLQVWLRRRSGEVPLRCALAFFTWDWSQPALRSVLTHSSCFVSWKFLILLTQTEIAVLCSPSKLLEAEPERASFLLFSSFFFISQILKKKARKIH